MHGSVNILFIVHVSICTITVWRRVQGPRYYTCYVRYVLALVGSLPRINEAVALVSARC